MRRSQKNTAGPERESTWPAMTADPVAPGRGLPVYQPTTVVLLGTWSVPFRLRPRVTTGAFTPMAGMVSQTGLGACWTVDSETGRTVRPEGAATGDGLAASRAAGAADMWAATKPAVPAPAASSPALSIATDSSRACAPQTAEDRRDTHKLIVVARICPQDGSIAGEVTDAGVAGEAAGAGEPADTGEAGEAAAGEATDTGDATGAVRPGGLPGRAGSAVPADVTTSQLGPHQSASTSQAGGSGWDVTAGMGQQSTPAGPVSTGMLGCVPSTTVRNGKTETSDVRHETDPACRPSYPC